MGLLRKLLRLPQRLPKNVQADALKQIALLNAYRRTFLDGNGNFTDSARIVIADLYQQAGILGSTLHRKVDGSMSVEDMLLNEGKRIMVMGLLRRIYKRPISAGGATPEEDEDIAKTLLEEMSELDL